MMDYLLEIGTEEIPARLVGDLAGSLLDGILKGMESAGLPPERSAWYGTPRRLTVHLEGLPSGQPDRTERALGPPAKAAFDADGRPTKAAQGFARSKGVAPEQLERVTTGKGEYAAVTVEVKGRPAAEVVVEAVREAVRDLYLPVSMRWGRGQGPFVRAVRWVVSLLDAEVLPLSLFGVQAGRETRGHRVLGPGPHAVAEPARYVEVLREKGRVEPLPERRREIITEGLNRLAAETGGTLAARSEELRDELLEELVMLIEHPVVVCGPFDGRFLTLPEEILDTSMRYHQKMFSLRGQDGRLLPHFLTVINNEDPDGEIVRGERQVLEARLEDAVFFWEKDRERGLESFAGELSRVVFQERLGSYADKVARMEEVARAFGEDLWQEGAGSTELLLQAVALCKADLCSLTVGEFPELQGIVGGLLAADSGMNEAVGRAVRQQYDPFSADNPLDLHVHALALLDNLDSLVGCHGVGVKATGSKDPFGLRRAAHAVARILTGGLAGGNSDLTGLLDASRKSFRRVEGFSGDDGVFQTLKMVEARQRFHLQEELGYPYDEVNAVMASLGERPAEALDCLKAVRELREAGKLDGLSVPLKRARNILQQAEGHEAGEVDEELLKEAAERELCLQLGKTRQEARPLLREGRYAEALERMAGLRPAVDRFFEEVLVMDEDPAVRNNRLNLLDQVRALFLEVADLGEIVEGTAAN